MLEHYFETRFALHRLRRGPSGPYIDGFAQKLKDEGYSPWVAGKYLRAASHVGRFVEMNRRRLEELDETLLMAFQVHLPDCQCPTSNGGRSESIVQGGRLFADYLCEIGILPKKPSEKLLPPLLQSFQDWLLHHRGVSETTAEGYIKRVATLLPGLGEDPGRYTAEAVRAVVFQRARRCGPATVQSLVTALRAFLRYLASQSLCPTGLDQALPRFPGWRGRSLPRYLSSSEVERLLDACDAQSGIGRRDRAMVLLLVRLGLRAGDVAGLRLSHIDWDDGSFLVSGKSGREVRLPLPEQVGEAVWAYLEERPHVHTNRLFLRAIAPYCPLSSRSVSYVVGKLMRRAGIDAPSYGSHILRHTAATQMLRQGASLYEIAAVLRHRSVATTTGYAKIHVGLLQQVAQPWPEVLPC